MQGSNWIGLRERNNFSYTLGQTPIYKSNCKNSLVISDSNKGNIEGISDHALILENGKEYLIPITEINRILEVAQNLLGERKIFYKKPSSILERETLNDLGKEFIHEKVFENYGVLIESVKKIQTKKGKHRVYEVASNKGIKFMLKYYGKDLNLFKSQINFLEENTLFSKIVNTRNLKSYVIFGDSIYYLEEFIEGNPMPTNSKFYYILVGKHLALVHNEFNKKAFMMNGLENRLNQKANPLSESNLISMKIDLGQNFGEYFSVENSNSFFEDLQDSENSLPFQIIHGDLNKSNLIWNGNNPKTIDFETINFSKRINEFIPALLLEGNLSIPRYSSGSLKELLDSYDSYSDKRLSEKERKILPDFLKISLLKSYVIYVIRRNLTNEKFKDQIEESLNIIGDEKNVY